jgi:hypothetical protein
MSLHALRSKVQSVHWPWSNTVMNQGNRWFNEKTKGKKSCETILFKNCE